MLRAKGPIAIFRSGVIVPGGKVFDIHESEVEDLKARGFEVIEVADDLRPNSGNNNIPQEDEPGVNTGDIQGKSEGSKDSSDEKKSEEVEGQLSLDEIAPATLTGGSAKPAAKMGAAGKATATAKVSTKKEG